MNNHQPENQNHPIPQLTTPETATMRLKYPSIEHLEAGNVPSWLQERRDQLWEIARSAEVESDASKIISLTVAGIGTVLTSTSPFAPIGAAIAGVAYIWTVFDDFHHTKKFSPIPLVRGNFLEFLSSMGDADARESYSVNHDYETIKFLNRNDRVEYVMLYDQFENIANYLNQVEPGKRFHAYRWILQVFSRYQNLPSVGAMQEYLKGVTPDTRINYQQVTAIASRPRFIELPTPKTVDIPMMPAHPADIPILSAQPQPATTEPSTPQEPPTETKEITFDKQIPNLPKLLASSLKLSLICGIPGSGKGVFISNALEEVRANKNRSVTIFYIDPKNDPKETAYFSGRVDYLFRKDLMTTEPQEAYEWVIECLRIYDDFDCEGGYKLLVFDEILLTLRTLQLVKGAVHWFKTKVTGYASSGDSRGIIFWGISQNAHVSGLGFDGGDRTMFIPVFIVDVRNISASVGLLASKMIPSDQRLSSKQIQELCEKSTVGRAIYFGGINRWYPMPKLNNYSGFDRDTRTFLPGFAPPPKGEKLVSNYQAIARLEESLKSEASHIIDEPVNNDLTEQEQILLSWIITRKTTGKEYDINTANKNLEKLVKPDDFDSKAEYIRHLARQLQSKNKGKLVNPNFFEPN